METKTKTNTREQKSRKKIDNGQVDIPAFCMHSTIWNINVLSTLLPSLSLSPSALTPDYCHIMLPPTYMCTKCIGLSAITIQRLSSTHQHRILYGFCTISPFCCAHTHKINQIHSGADEKKAKYLIIFDFKSEFG